MEVNQPVEGSSSTILDNLLQVAEQTGVQPTELAEAPVLPSELEPILEVYLELCGTRTVGLAANPITFTEIKAWQDLYNTSLELWEIRVIRTLDTTYLASQREKK